MKKTMMAVCAVFALTACTKETVYYMESTTTTIKPVSTTAAPYVPPTTDYSLSKEDLFVRGVYDLYSPIYVSDAELIDTGYAVCAALRSGMSGEESIASTMEASDYDAETFAFLAAILASAVVTLCPDQSFKFDSI